MLVIDQLKNGGYQLRLLASVVLVGLAVLGAGLFYTQVLMGQRYRTSQVNQSFRTVRLPAIRGRIYDRAGVALAENRPAYNVNLYLEEMRGFFQSTYRERTEGARLSRSARLQLGRDIRYEVVSNIVHRMSEAIGEPLSLGSREFHRHYNEKLALPLTIARDLDLASVSRFVEQGANLPGLELEVQPMRYYPHGALAAHTLGHLRRDDRPADEDLYTRYSLPDFKGVAGSEGFWDQSLRGQPGVKSVLVNNLGYRHSETVWEPAEAGADIHLTLDVRAQHAAEAALHSGGPRTRGAVVVMDVHSGDLLALASSPAFDPNSFVPSIGHEEYATLMDPILRPQFSRATAGMYAPGSIFKVIVALAALEAGILQPDRIYHSPGYYLLGSGPRARKIRDTANGGRPASFDFREAFKQSSNAYFIHYGMLTGLDDIVALGQKFHLGELTALPVGYEEAGDFPTPEWREHKRSGVWHVGETANLCIGQGAITVTPVQMAVMTAAVANGGRVLWPRLVTRIVPRESHQGHKSYAIPAGRVREHLGLSERSFRLVRDAMLADVEDEEGTGRRARMEGYQIAAKTGTAQVKKRYGMDHITWFVAFGPYENPEFAVVVMIESGQSGGETCAPIAKQVFTALRELPRVVPAVGGLAAVP